MSYTIHMARRKSRKQAKPTELLIGYGIAAVGLVSAGAFYIPPEAIASFITLLFCGAALGGIWFYYFVYLKEQARRQALLALDIAQVDEMSGIEFENYVEALFQAEGYRTETTPRSGDYGVDIIASKNKQRIAVQCKRYKKTLDQTPVREVYAGMSKHGCTIAMVVTNRGFTKHAVELARSVGCILIDREKLGLLASKKISIDQFVFREG